ncbi:MAG: ABC1 kinase family protein [Anaerolineae bacterium]
MPLGLAWWRPFAEIARLRRIGEILLKNGLGFLVEHFELGRFMPGWRRRALGDGPAASLSMPERVRRTLEELGPTYIKLGQLLSTRPDLLPPDVIAQLSLLLDSAPPVPAKDIRQQLEAELGQVVERAYATFDWEPIASASIGQVHRATLPNGERVVVKVQRPGVERVVAADLDLLMRQLRFVERRSAALRDYHLADLLDEFAASLREELDYTIEGRNADRLRRNLGPEPLARVPRIHWELTTRRVITMEDLGGLTLTDLPRLREANYDLPAVADLVVQLYLKMVFDDGFFHGDPHPANILVCDERIGLVDFGMMGHLSDATKANLRDVLWAVVAQDVEEMVEVIRRMDAMAPHTDRPALARDLQRFLRRYHGIALEDVPIADLLRDFFGACLRHHLRLPAEMAVLMRTVLLLEGLALALDPTYDFVVAVQPFVARIAAERYSPRHLSQQGLRALRQAERLALDLPPRLGNITAQMERGQLTLGVDVRRLENILRRLDVVANRLAFSIVVAAMIVGSSLILMGGETAARFYLPLIGVPLPIAQIGFILAGLMAAWLLLSIIRTRGV